MNSSIEKFIDSIINEKFKEAHELLEDDWRYYKKIGDKKKAKALQGLINGATSLALFKLKRMDAHKRVWLVFEKYKNLLDEIKFDNHQRYFDAKDILEERKSKLVSN